MTAPQTLNQNPSHRPDWAIGLAALLAVMCGLSISVTAPPADSQGSSVPDSSLGALAPSQNSESLPNSPSQAGEAFSFQQFQIWLAQDTRRQSDLDAFEAFLSSNNVHNVVPTFQILRTSTASVGCNMAQFEIPPRRVWPNVVATLAFARNHVMPASGPLEAVSGYRPPALNACSGGAEGSAHADFFALDFVPVAQRDFSRVVKAVCRAHARFGPAQRIGLGFYSAQRFHLDSRSFRKWGPDGTRYTSPCWAALGLPTPVRPPDPEEVEAEPGSEAKALPTVANVIEEAPKAVAPALALKAEPVSSRPEAQKPAPPEPGPVAASDEKEPRAEAQVSPAAEPPKPE